MTKSDSQIQFEKRIQRLAEERLYVMPRRRATVRTIKVIPWHKKLSLKQWLMYPLTRV